MISVQSVALLGRPEEARAYYEEAIGTATVLRCRPEIARTRLELAELLLAHYPNQKAKAREHLNFPIGEFKEFSILARNTSGGRAHRQHATSGKEPLPRMSSLVFVLIVEEPRIFSR